MRATARLSVHLIKKNNGFLSGAGDPGPNYDSESCCFLLSSVPPLTTHHRHYNSSPLNYQSEFLMDSQMFTLIMRETLPPPSPSPTLRGHLDILINLLGAWMLGVTVDAEPSPPVIPVQHIYHDVAPCFQVMLQVFCVMGWNTFRAVSRYTSLITTCIKSVIDQTMLSYNCTRLWGDYCVTINFHATRRNTDFLGNCRHIFPLII